MSDVGMSGCRRLGCWHIWCWRAFVPAHPSAGGTYGDKQETLRRFAANFKRLSPACQARVTVENDDRASMFSVADLLGLHEMLKPLCPIVFDLHHWRFATGENVLLNSNL